jgi:hypothetical protein
MNCAPGVSFSIDICERTSGIDDRCDEKAGMFPIAGREISPDHRTKEMRNENA